MDIYFDQINTLWWVVIIKRTSPNLHICWDKVNVSEKLALSLDQEKDELKQSFIWNP